MHSLQDSKKKLSNRFIFSILMLIIGISLLTILIVSIPKVPRVSLLKSDFDAKDNFFYDVRSYYSNNAIYNETSGYYDIPGYYLWGVVPNTGFYLFISIAIVFLVLSGSTMLVTSFEETRKLIFASWGLYSIPVVAGIVQTFLLYQLYNVYFSYFDEGQQYTWALGLYPVFMNLLIQITLLLDRKSFIKWSGFSRKSYPSNFPSIYLKQRRNRAVFFIICYLASIGLIIPSAFATEVGLGYVQEFAFYFLTPVMGIYLVWFLFSEQIARQRARKKAAKRFVVKGILRGETDLTKLSEKYFCSLEDITYFINDAINDDILYGMISSDGLTFVPDSERMTTKSQQFEGEEFQQPIPTGASVKSRTTALLLCLFFGNFGAHRFYVGRSGSGVAYLCTFGIFSIGSFVDLIMILAGSFKDSFGNLVSDWEPKPQQPTQLFSTPQQPQSQLIYQPPQPNSHLPVPSATPERQAAMRKIIKMYDSLLIDEMAQLLFFEDRITFQRWLMSLPDELTFVIHEGRVLIPPKLKEATPEAERLIEQLLSSFHIR